MDIKRTIRVVAAIVVDKNRYFAAKRSYGEWKGCWGFPGGKIESNETPEDALRREVKEEIGANISIGDKVCT